jgi:hypothetical protein
MYQKSKLISIAGYPAPDFNKLVEGHMEYDTTFSYTLNYTNYVFEPADMKKHVEQWLDRSFKDVPDFYFVSVGQIAWILNNGGYVKPDIIERVSKKINNLPVKEEKKVEKVSESSKRITELMCAIEGLIDDTFLSKPNHSDIEKLMENIPQLECDKLAGHFEEVDQAIDEEFTDVQKRKIMHSILCDIINALWKTSPKKRTRKVKKLPPSHVVRKLNFLKESSELSFVSISAEKIIGAEVLWVFNQKNRKLGQYVAKDENGLSVKGSTVLNFDETKSFQKILRKPKDLLKKVTESGKVGQRSILDTINAVNAPLTGRINGDTLLVKTF